MLDYIYEWMENIAFYMVIVVAAMQMVAGESYKKYIRFFAGMILIIMLTGPILKIFGMSEFQVAEYQKELEEIENALNSLAGIVRSCCLFDREKNKISCFYVGVVEKTLLKKQLKLSLPGYMVPQKLCSIDQMPMNKNGKMDRNQLMTWAKEGLGS